MTKDAHLPIGVADCAGRTQTRQVPFLGTRHVALIAVDITEQRKRLGLDGSFALRHGELESTLQGDCRRSNAAALRFTRSDRAENRRLERCGTGGARELERGGVVF